MSTTAKGERRKERHRAKQFVADKVLVNDLLMIHGRQKGLFRLVAKTSRNKPHTCISLHFLLDRITQYLAEENARRILMGLERLLPAHVAAHRDIAKRYLVCGCKEDSASAPSSARLGTPAAPDSSAAASPANVNAVQWGHSGSQAIYLATDSDDEDITFVNPQFDDVDECMCSSDSSESSCESEEDDVVSDREVRLLKVDLAVEPLADYPGFGI